MVMYVFGILLGVACAISTDRKPSRNHRVGWSFRKFGTIEVGSQTQRGSLWSSQIAQAIHGLGFWASVSDLSRAEARGFAVF